MKTTMKVSLALFLFINVYTINASTIATVSGVLDDPKSIDLFSFTLDGPNSSRIDIHTTSFDGGAHFRALLSMWKADGTYIKSGSSFGNYTNCGWEPGTGLASDCDGQDAQITSRFSFDAGDYILAISQEALGPNATLPLDSYLARSDDFCLMCIDEMGANNTLRPSDYFSYNIVFNATSISSVSKLDPLRPVPALPAVYLMVSGLIGLVGFRHKQKKS